MKQKNNKGYIIGLSICVVVFVGGMVTRYFINWETLPYYGHMFSGWMMPFGMLGMIAFWLFVILLVTRSFGSRRMSGCCGHESMQEETALKTLKDRLSKGEISIEEYEAILKRIKEDQ